MGSLESGQAKWNAKTAKAFRAKWAANFASPAAFEAWAQGIADATGLSAQQVASSLPGQNFRSAQGQASIFMDKAIRNIERAASTNKWSKNFRAAFER